MGFLSKINDIISDLLKVFFPNTCEVCEKTLIAGEEHLCIECLYNLPRCNVHNSTFNTIHQRLMRHVPIEKAGAYFYYIRDSRFTELILSAKYRNRPEIIRLLSTLFAQEILPDGFFDEIDIIIPVPMHKWKKIKRGYNQTDFIAKGLNEITGIPISHNLIATRGHSTQTHKKAYDRWINSRNIYAAQNIQDIAGKHILIVDDVITTGATMSACCEAIHTASPTTKISVLSIGLTSIQ